MHIQLEELEIRLNIAKEAAREAARIQRENFHTNFLVEAKSSGIDLVTSIDKQCDQLIRTLIQERCEAAGFGPQVLLTEETFIENSTIIDLEDAWIVDPLDGTTNYAHGFPHFAVSIAYAIKGSPCVGVVLEVSRNELFHAVRGHGAFLDDTPLKPSAVTSLKQALLATGFPYDTHVRPEDNMGYFQKFLGVCHGIRRAGAAAVDLAYVAAGRLDGFWELRLSPWDVAAGALIIEEAGGLVSDFHGLPLNYGLRRINIAASNGGPLHDEIIDICKGSPTAIRYAHQEGIF